MNMNEGKENEFFILLLKAVPEFRQVYDEVMSYDGQLLSTLMLDALARFLCGRLAAETCCKIPPNQIKDVARRTAEFLEERLDGGDKEEVEMILSGFVEGLLGDDNVALSVIRPLFGPKLEKALAMHLD